MKVMINAMKFARHLRAGDFAASTWVAEYINRDSERIEIVGKTIVKNKSLIVDVKSVRAWDCDGNREEVAGERDLEIEIEEMLNS